MFKVYWCEGTVPHCKDFSSVEMKLALDFMNDLRDNTCNSFVTMCSENPNQVGKMGVAETGPGYNWTKRRNNERIMKE